MSRCLPRPATSEERLQYIKFTQRVTKYSFRDAADIVDDLYMVVIDDFVSRGYYGKLMITVSTECVFEMAGWSKKGRMFVLYCSG